MKKILYGLLCGVEFFLSFANLRRLMVLVVLAGSLQAETPPAGNSVTVDLAAPYFMNASGDTIASAGLMHGYTTRLGRVTAVNMNATGDKNVTIWTNKYIVTGLIMYDASGTPAAILAFTLRDTASGGGNSLIGSVVGLNTVVTGSIAGFLQSSPVALMGARQLTATTLFINVSVANGSALTASFDVIGINLN